jgi:phospholipid/cholesterol/gamma-HCH transport system permease protein
MGKHSVPRHKQTGSDQTALQWLREWWRLIHLSAIILVLAFTRSSYNAANRTRIYWHVYRNTAPILVGFALLCAILTVVLTRIVLVTALSYGLTQFALQVVIRVLVLELIPLTAALFVALRCTIPAATELTQMRGERNLQTDVLPRVLAGVLASITLAAQSCVVALVMAYLVGYGFNLAGLPDYTRMFGQVFSPAVGFIFVFKTLLFSLTVSLIPMASTLQEAGNNPNRRLASSAEMRALVRMFVVLLAVEVISLIGNYY